MSKPEDSKHNQGHTILLGLVIMIVPLLLPFNKDVAIDMRLVQSKAMYEIPLHQLLLMCIFCYIDWIEIDYS